MPLAFDPDGLLPVGDHTMTMTELRNSLLVNGTPACDPNWDAAWRAHLVEQLSILCVHLHEVGIVEIFADGSFATDKAKPGDIDGYFVCDYELFLSEQFPRLVARDEAWDLRQRRPDRHGKMKPLMWHRYHVELFPQFTPPFESLSVADTSPQGKHVLFPEFFRRTRTGQPRGIVRIAPENKP